MKYPAEATCGPPSPPPIGAPGLRARNLSINAFRSASVSAGMVTLPHHAGGPTTPGTEPLVAAVEVAAAPGDPLRFGAALEVATTPGKMKPLGAAVDVAATPDASLLLPTTREVAATGTSSPPDGFCPHPAPLAQAASTAIHQCIPMGTTRPIVSHRGAIATGSSGIR